MSEVLSFGDPGLTPLTVVLPFASVDELIDLYCGCVTRGGIYLPIEPKPVRTMVRLEVRVRTGGAALVAVGVISFVTRPGGKGHPGVGVRFVQLDEAGQELVRKACAGRAEAETQLPPVPPSVEVGEYEDSQAIEVDAPALPDSPGLPSLLSLIQTPAPASQAAAAPVPAPPSPASTAAPPREGRRIPRAPVSLGVTFQTAGDAACAFANGIVPTGIAIVMKPPLPVSTPLNLTVNVPGWKQPLVAPAEVAESSPDAVAIRFPSLTSDDSRLIKRLSDDASLVGRLSSAFFSKSQSTSAGKPVVAKLSRVASAVLLLSDEMLADAAAELLGQEGIVTYDGPPEGMRPSIVAATGAQLATAARTFPGVPIVAVNLSDDELVGEMSRLRLVAFVKKPATGASLTRAICKFLHP